MVLDLLNMHGPAGYYDFFYLPIDFQTGASLGYAFVNFATSADALQAQCLLEGFDKWEVPSYKVLEMSWSGLSQGLQANIDRYRNSSVFHPAVPEEFQPVLFNYGAA